ncbi:MAG: aminoacyl-tRNA hydrolase [bacterium]|nr:aminoacyl-tRNA hydrolase [bacterium]
MKLIVGLGNPGEKYARNRHNLGFMVVDEMVKGQIVSPTVDKKSESNVYKVGETILQKPMTFMNLSGRAVKVMADFYKIPAENILVIHDEVDLEFGDIKHQFDRGAAGHNGVDSVIQSLGTQEFHRLRVGVGRGENPNIETADWVLQDFAESKEEVEKLITRAAEVAENWIGKPR